MKSMFYGTLATSGFFIILCVLIFTFFPNNQVSKATETEATSISTVTTEDLIEPDNYHSALASYSDKKDIGLELYRSLQSRAAVMCFYTSIVGDTDIALAILEYADKNSIPLSLAFSLAYAESRYCITAVNQNKNDSIDRGLFQLNNRSFPQLQEQEFFNPYISAKYGMSHLRFCIDTAGNEIAGLAMYNAGSNKVKRNGTPQHTLNYVSIIMNYREGLDELFRTQVSEYYKAQPTTYIAKATD